MDMQTTVRREMVRSLVMRRITCSITGQVLDMDTCAVVIDADGDPIDVADPAVMDVLPASFIEKMAAKGCKMVVAPFA